MPPQATALGPVGAPSQNTRRLLLAGFGGLLALMAFAGLDTMRALQTIQNRNDAIRSEFLARNRLLNEIRSDLYLSGTYVRDYLLEPETVKAESHRAALDHSRRDMESALRQYAALANARRVNTPPNDTPPNDTPLMSRDREGAVAFA